MGLWGFLDPRPDWKHITNRYGVPPRRKGLDHDDHDVFAIGKEQMPRVKCNWCSMIDLMQTTSTCVSPTTKVWKGAVANHPGGPKVKEKQ